MRGDRIPPSSAAQAVVRPDDDVPYARRIPQLRRPTASSTRGWRILALATIAMGLTGPGQTIGVSVFIDHFADDLDLSKNAISAGCDRDSLRS